MKKSIEMKNSGEGKTKKQKSNIPKRITFENREYIWDGKTWYDAKSSLIPPLNLQHKLNGLLVPELMKEDEQISDIFKLFARAREAKETAQYNRAENILNKILKINPGNLSALAMLCSTLRENQEPERALAVTEPYKNHRNEFLLTSRTAAFCDLEQWENAYLEARRAFAIAGKGHDAISILFNRIRGAAPDLFRDE